MNLTSDQTLALAVFLDVFGDGYLADDLGSKLTCNEADSLIGLFEAFELPDAAQAWLRGHAFGDDEGDSHYEEEL